MTRRAAAGILLAVAVLARTAHAAPGDLDPAFGSGGRVITAVPSSNEAVYALALQPDGKLIAGGNAFVGGDYDFALVRYNADGGVDSSFDTTGTGGQGAAVRALVLQPDGKVVAVGTTYGSSKTYDFAVARYDADGTLDGGFGTGGEVVTPVGSSNDAAYALALQPNGKLVAAGYAFNGTDWDFALVRYNGDGSVDGTFGSGGAVITPVGSGDDVAYAVVVQPDGKVVAAGYTFNGTDFDFALVRYTATGALDGSFGNGGLVVTPIGSRGDLASALVLQPDGKLVAAGYTDAGTRHDFALVRYAPNGSLDASFGAGGKVSTTVATAGGDVSALVLQADGKLVAAGTTYGSNPRFVLVRYAADGSVDPTFGAFGKMTTAIGTGGGNASALVLQPDANLVAAGATFNGSDYDFALVRYLGQVCGDGIPQSPEQCDEGAANGNGTACCAATCRLKCPSDQCNTGSCDPSTGTCTSLPKANGTTCNDSDPCTRTDRCQNGTCTGTNPVVCFAQDQCHVAGTCDSGAGGCSNPIKSDGSPCNDGDPCTADDACSGGGCAGKPIQGCATATTTTTSSTTAPAPTTAGCPDAGFEGVRCLLSDVLASPECGGENVPQSIQRPLGQARSLLQRGAAATSPKKARPLVRKAAKALKKAAGLATTAASKQKLSVPCGAALSGTLREAERRAERLAI